MNFTVYLTLILMFLPLLLSHASSDEISGSGLIRDGQVGDWTPIKDPKSTKMEDLARFAVSEYNSRHKAMLKFKGVVMAEMQGLSSGIKYRITLVAQNSRVSLAYQAVVWEKASDHSRTLVWFLPTE